MLRRKQRHFVAHRYGETISMTRVSYNDLEDALAEGGETKLGREQEGGRAN
jgi:hypothetical protein